MPIQEHLKKGLLITLSVCVGIVIGWYACPGNRISATILAQKRESREKNTSTFFTSPLLECSDYDSISNKTVNEVKEEVSALIQDWEKKPEVEKISVYFRDLNNGPWFGLGEKEEFIPGSLLKVPLMISVLREAMENPNILDREVLLVKDESFKQEIASSASLEFGKKYTIAQLVEAMIRFSDNSAADALFKNLKAERLEQSYSDLGISVPQNDQYTVSVRTYASFFRILYNATYVSQAYSEKALYLLANTEFNDGIVAGVPSSVFVAHKFGERFDEKTGLKQLHDCGIIYLPNRPYLLCIMSKGSNVKVLEEVTADVSRIIYRKLR
jgi:beta-lactamase class A